MAVAKFRNMKKFNTHFWVPYFKSACKHIIFSQHFVQISFKYTYKYKIHFNELNCTFHDPLKYMCSIPCPCYFFKKRKNSTNNSSSKHPNPNEENHSSLPFKRAMNWNNLARMQLLYSSTLYNGAFSELRVVFP